MGPTIDVYITKILGCGKDIRLHRLSWNILVIVGLLGLEDLMRPALAHVVDPLIVTKAIFSKLAGPSNERVSEINNMDLQLQKLGYWNHHSYKGYYLDGTYVSLP